MFGFWKDWAVEICTDLVFKMFWKPRNEQNKSQYYFLKNPVLGNKNQVARYGYGCILL